MQTGEPGKTVDYGVVSDGHGFEDSPDCERIAGGINSKGPHAVAIGRQANMLQWGFYASPDRMTDSAKMVFLNALVYMQQFDGHRPLVEKTMSGRTWLRQFVDSIRGLDPEEDNERRLNYYRGRFPESAIEVAGLDPDALDRWLDANLEYLYGEGRRGLKLDQDLQQLGLSNRKPEFLDWLHKRLTGHPDDAVARRLARRYLSEGIGDDPTAALAWLERNRARLFFSDQGGYRWRVNTIGQAAPTDASTAAETPAATGGTGS
ncbi:MAG: hypothetical protein AAF628_15985 [Planctomycetota bacterium]